MEVIQQHTELLWIAKTERAYLQVLADEACKQLAIRDDVITSQENSLQQKHSDQWPTGVELPARCHDLVAAPDFISNTVADVVRQCLALRTADLAAGVATATAADDEDGGDGVSGASASQGFDPTSQLGGGHGCCTEPAGGLVTSEIRINSEGPLPRVAESTRPMSATEAPAAVLGEEMTSAGSQTASAGTQTTSAGTQTAGDQLAQLTAEREDQARMLQQQTGLLAQLHSQLTRSAAENEQLQRHLLLVNALFEQLQHKEAASSAEGAGQPRPDGADGPDAAAEDGGGDGAADGELVERVDTAHGRRLVIHVSRTYLRLRDLILEKRSLLSEIDKLRGFNQQLERRLSKQERRLSSVAAELHSTWGLVTKLKIQHAQLHTAESVLRYELREKRKILSRLRGELEGSRQRSALASQLNAESELEWRALRRELDQRKREALVRQPRVQEPQDGGEAGGEAQTGEGVSELRQEHAAVLERSSTDDSQQDGELAEQDGELAEQDGELAEQDGAGLDTSVAESESTESESAGRRTPESQPADSVDSASPAGAAESASERRRRLVSLEDQCQQLYTRLVSTTARQVALSSRLAELHAQHGGSGDAETTPDTSVASSGDTAYASLADSPPTPIEAEQLSSDQPAPVAAAAVLVEVAPPPLAVVAAVSAVATEPLAVAVVAAVSAVATEPPSPLAVAAQRVAVQTDGGPRALPPLPASQLATETAHRAGGDHAIVSAVVAVTEAPTAAGQPTEAAAAAEVEEEEESDTDGPDSSLDDADEAEDAGEGAAACEDDVSRSTAELLEKVGQFLSRSHRGGGAAAPPAPPPASEAPWSDSETDETARLDGASSAGCKLISMLPSRMVNLRREREQLTEHIARLQVQNERIEQKLARMRTERREQRLRGREDSTAKEHLERKVQQLERQLRLQLAERYAVAAPAPTETEQQQRPGSPGQVTDGPTSTAPPDTDGPTSTAPPDTEPQLYEGFAELSSGAEPSDSFLNPASEFLASPAEVNAASELPASPAEVNSASELFGSLTEVSSASELPASPTEVNSTSEFPARPIEMDRVSELTARPTEVNSASEHPASPSEVNPASEIPARPIEVNSASELTARSTEVNSGSDLPANPSEVNLASELSARPIEMDRPSELLVSSSRLSTPSGVHRMNPPVEIDLSPEYAANSRQSELEDHLNDTTLPEPAHRPLVNGGPGVCPRRLTEDIVTTPGEDGALHHTASNAASHIRDSLQTRCGDDGATVESDDTPAEASDNSPFMSASEATHQAERKAAPGVETVDCPAAVSDPSPAVEGPRAPERPLDRLQQQLADTRGQLQSVQADCRRARHTLQQMRVTAQQEESNAEAVTSSQRTAASRAVEVPVQSQACSCRCSTPRVNYTEFRRRLTERLSSRPTAKPSGLRRPGSLFKRTGAKCHMCQGSLRPLFARRVTCRACGQLFCRRCACLAVHLPATGEMRMCVHCFYDLSASAPLQQTAASTLDESKPIDSSQVAGTGNGSTN